LGNRLEGKAVGNIYARDAMFAEAAGRREAGYWAPDGVHPSPAGHALIAQAVRDAIGI